MRSVAAQGPPRGSAPNDFPLSHATSAARYLGECLPKAEYWDVAVPEQTEARTSGRLLEFLSSR